MGESKEYSIMKASRLWMRALSTVSRAQEEIVKISQMGKTQINRSFLLHERNKLFRNLGEKTYFLAKEKKLKSVELDRLIDQLDRVGRKVSEIESRMKELTRDFSLKLDAEENTDIKKQKKNSKKIQVKERNKK